MIEPTGQPTQPEGHDLAGSALGKVRHAAFVASILLAWWLFLVVWSAVSFWAASELGMFRGTDVGVPMVRQGLLGALTGVLVFSVPILVILRAAMTRLERCGTALQLGVGLGVVVVGGAFMIAVWLIFLS